MLSKVHSLSRRQLPTSATQRKSFSNISYFLVKNQKLHIFNLDELFVLSDSDFNVLNQALNSDLIQKSVSDVSYT